MQWFYPPIATARRTVVIRSIKEDLLQSLEALSAMRLATVVNMVLYQVTDPPHLF